MASPLGDWNARFYYLSTIARHKHNKIESLKIDFGEWCTYNNLLQSHALDYFMQLFASFDTNPVQPLRPVNSDSHHILSQHDQEFLARKLQFWETTKAIKSMQSYKASGFDGF